MMSTKTRQFNLFGNQFVRDTLSFLGSSAVLGRAMLGLTELHTGRTHHLL